MMPPAPPTFSSETHDALTRAIRSFDPQSAEADAELRMQVVHAVAEARALGWKPDDLMRALRAAIPEEAIYPGMHATVFAVMKRSALVSYFGGQLSAF